VADASIMRARPLDTLARISTWLFVPSLLATTLVRYHYADTRPKKPQPEVGRVYAINTHGSVVYLTLAEQIKLVGSELVPIILFGLAGATRVFSRWKSNCPLLGA
jgi:hypothetical protein